MLLLICMAGYGEISMQGGAAVSSIRFVINSSQTYIDNIFIDQYMTKAASPVYSLVYIYALRCAQSGISVTNSQIADKLGIIESDVINAWKQWQSEGLVKLTGTREEPVVEFLDINERPAKEETEKVKIVSSKPCYSPNSIKGLINDNRDVKELLGICESIIAKPLTPRETEMLVWMYDSLELPLDVITVLVTYCKNNSKPIRYMEKTAVDWAERGIFTCDAATDYLSIFSSYGKVLKFFGITGRGPSASEKKYIDKWILDCNMPLEVIEIACSKTLENTGKAAFSYANKIIENWHKAGISSIEAVEKADTEFADRSEKNRSSGPNRKNNNAFTNYEQKIYTEEEIEEILSRKRAKKK